MPSANLDLICRLLPCFNLQDPEYPNRPVNYQACSCDGTRLVRAAGVWYFLTDNGGELNLVKINHGYLGSIPLTSWGYPVNEATIACRLAMLLRGDPVEYKASEFSSEEQTILLLDGPKKI